MSVCCKTHHLTISSLNKHLYLYTVEAIINVSVYNTYEPSVTLSLPFYFETIMAMRVGQWKVELHVCCLETTFKSEREGK